ncbi:MAG: 50S ribosomal protein L10 [Sporocytophaga sp.]|uniref:50S ribosomal protein L10 n=1 Tax=Sporocytophaga sp. TaxID=2231183 RepID=UPI001B07CE93|nr:50S ribosomal protein L10 [Sporocytophaga sp.]MBO9700197.1 50S ribosomal protein L10 [Sporocytophaga sp.]
MTKEQKAQIIEELSQKFASKNYFYITDASGLSVEQVNKFRKLCFKKGIEYTVVKNSLIKKALANLNTDYTPFNQGVLKGFSGILFADAGNAPAKLLKEYHKEGGKGFNKPTLKGASIDGGLFIGEDTLDLLSNLKSKNELIGDIIGLLQSPAKNVVSALQSGGNKLAGIVKTLSEKPE